MAKNLGKEEAIGMMERLATAQIVADLRYLPGGGALRGFDRYAIYVEDANLRTAGRISGYISDEADLDEEAEDSSIPQDDDGMIEKDSAKVGFWVKIIVAGGIAIWVALVAGVAIFEMNKRSNKAPDRTAPSVTPPAGQETRH